MHFLFPTFCFLITKIHSITDGQTDRQMTLWCQGPIIPHAVWSAKNW